MKMNVRKWTPLIRTSRFATTMSYGKWSLQHTKSPLHVLLDQLLMFSEEVCLQMLQKWDSFNESHPFPINFIRKKILDLVLIIINDVFTFRNPIFLQLLEAEERSRTFISLRLPREQKNVCHIQMLYHATTLRMIVDTL